MSKILKHLKFGQKKNPPAPPRPDYGGNSPKSPKGQECPEPYYANLPGFPGVPGSSVRFKEKEENKLVVFQEYSEPADLRAELSALVDDEYGPLYMSPIDQVPSRNEAVTQEEEDQMYSVPYEESKTAPPLPSPCLNTIGSFYRKDSLREDSASDCYEAVPDLTNGLTDPCPSEASGARDGDGQFNQTSSTDARPSEEYDEPWEWTEGGNEPGAVRASSSFPELTIDANVEEHTYSEPAASPQGAFCESPISDLESCCEEVEGMTARQRRLYETAFDSRVKRDIDDIDRLMQSPVLQEDIFRPRIKPGEAGPVLRTASRSSFGSTSGSSTSSTPTHQPQIVSKPSPRPRHYPLHLTPTERRKVTLIRDNPRSSSPLSRPIKVITSVEPLQRFNNRNSSRTDNRLITGFERQLSLRQWDNGSRCSDKSSSSQESMDQREDFVALSGQEEEEQPKLYPVGKSASRDSIAYRDSVTPSRNLNSQVKNKNIVDNVIKKDDSPSAVTRKPVVSQTGAKVQPVENGRPAGKPPNKPVVGDTAASNSSEKTSVTQVLNAKQESPARFATSITPASSENNEKPKPFKAVRPNSLASNCTSLLPAKAQTPENDDRPSDDYDPPWEFKPGPLRSSRVNGSQSVPESLSRNAVETATSSETVEEKDEVAEEVVNEPPSKNSDSETDNSTAPPVPKPSKPSGPPARPNLNLNLNLNSDSPRRASRQGLTLNFGCSALNAIGEKVDADLTLEKQGWYHGSISRHDAENLLRVLKEGSYLVRNSESSKHDYSLSLKSARGFMHMKIVHTDGHFILGQFSNPFSSIPEMVHHYSINKLPIKGAEHMSLLYPVIDQLL